MLGKFFCKINQGSQGLWMGPKGRTVGAKRCSSPQELEKTLEAGYFSSILIYTRLYYWTPNITFLDPKIILLDPKGLYIKFLDP